jgi:hypothetical protein
LGGILGYHVLPPPPLGTHIKERTSKMGKINKSTNDYGGFAAAVTSLESTTPVPPARMVDSAGGGALSVGRFSSPTGCHDELDEGGGGKVGTRPSIVKDECPVDETMEAPNNKKRQSLVTVNIEEEDASVSSTIQHRRPSHPYANASLASKFFFSWPYNLMGKKTARCRVIQESDLPDVLHSDTSEENSRKFHWLWEQEKARANKVFHWHNDKTARNDSAFETMPKTAFPSLVRAIKNDYLSTLWFVQLSMFANNAGKLVQALSLGFLLQSLESQDGMGYIFAGSLVLSGFVVLVSHHHCWWWTTQKA